MNASAIGTATRAVGLALVIALAAIFGLMFGNAVQRQPSTNAGYPQGWQGGAAAPLSRTADSAFSLDTIAAVQAARGDAQSPDYVDYAQRHAAPEAAAPTKESLAKPTLR
jgi:uncharacterized iron-regulated membrane protein